MVIFPDSYFCEPPAELAAAGAEVVCLFGDAFDTLIRAGFTLPELLFAGAQELQEVELGLPRLDLARADAEGPKPQKVLACPTYSSGQQFLNSAARVQFGHPPPMHDRQVVVWIVLQVHSMLTLTMVPGQLPRAEGANKSIEINATERNLPKIDFFEQFIRSSKEKLNVDVTPSIFPVKLYYILST